METTPKSRVLILGGGFAGVNTASHLEKLLFPPDTVQLGAGRPARDEAHHQSPEHAAQEARPEAVATSTLPTPVMAGMDAERCPQRTLPRA